MNSMVVMMEYMTFLNKLVRLWASTEKIEGNA
jgi:hypothetical protein